MLFPHESLWTQHCLNFIILFYFILFKNNNFFIITFIKFINGLTQSKETFIQIMKGSQHVKQYYIRPLCTFHDAAVSMIWDKVYNNYRQCVC